MAPRYSASTVRRAARWSSETSLNWSSHAAGALPAVGRGVSPPKI
ncbi:hypothetical protein [Methylibium sp. T29-B]|nr:hypothetical protein [Methylibium sp. T29-B]